MWRNKVLRSKPRARRHVWGELSCGLSRNPSGDFVIPRVEVRVRAQASYRNITVLSHLNYTYSKLLWNKNI